MKQALTVFKALADENRLKIVRALTERDMYAELLAERLQLTPATISFHMKKLQTAGLVDSRKEQYYTVYSIRKEVLGMTVNEFIAPDNESTDTAEALREEMYRRKVIKSFMPLGFCKTMPAQHKKRLIIYEEIMKKFETGATYTEKEVNNLIAEVHEDYCTVRRAFVGMGWMTRADGVYTVHGVINDGGI